jgi:large subunit ribosomal protein L5
MQEAVEEKEENVMKRVRIGKVVINMAVGKSGEPLERAKRVISLLTDQKPCERKAKKTIRDFGIHRGEPIAVIVTVRGQKALELLKKLLAAKDNKIKASSFDDYGNVSFGIKEHIDIPGMKYDPNIGIFGMDVNVQLVRPGYRIKERKRARSKIGKGQIVTKKDAIKFFKEVVGAEVVE